MASFGLAQLAVRILVSVFVATLFLRGACGVINLIASRRRPRDGEPSDASESYEAVEAGPFTSPTSAQASGPDRILPADRYVPSPPFARMFLIGFLLTAVNSLINLATLRLNPTASMVAGAAILSLGLNVAILKVMLPTSWGRSAIVMLAFVLILSLIVGSIVLVVFCLLLFSEQR